MEDHAARHDAPVLLAAPDGYLIKLASLARGTMRK